MSVPLGRAVGNALEVAESVEVLRGGGPADVVALTVALAEEMLALAGIDADPADGARVGRGVPGVGGDDRGPGRRPVGPAADRRARRRSCGRSGPACCERCDALAVGVAAWRLGAGRARKEHAVQAAAGIRLLAELGDAVEAGQPLLELHTDTPDAVPGALAALEGGVVVGDGPAPRASPADRRHAPDAPERVAPTQPPCGRSVVGVVADQLGVRRRRAVRRLDLRRAGCGAGSGGAGAGAAAPRRRGRG